ncbi:MULTISPECIES: hypothetical protein [unclassified Sporolactobacillus]|uniref:hypothetical protein n=1 Tax=unclassified Sporolactobacillus TaxID=2628533 RepID=UPI00236764C4|nr:hypothetical protein [Sporolactobacillus sp. CQH2019]MDD9147542.1 hypothetical protein [Sporolactobacillus sp. CQH2019]
MDKMKQRTTFMILEDLAERSHRAFMSYVPEEARKHLLLSRKEVLLGIDVILQRAIDRCDEQVIAAGRNKNRQSGRSIDITD